MSQYASDTYRRDYYHFELNKNLTKFVRKNPRFGRKIYKRSFIENNIEITFQTSVQKIVTINDYSNSHINTTNDSESDNNEDDASNTTDDDETIVSS